MSIAGAWSRALFEAIDGITEQVGEMHGAIAKRPFDIAEHVPAVREPVAGIRVVHDGITSSVYASVRAAASIAGRVVSGVLDTVPDPTGPTPTLDLATSVINGAVGDHLERRGSELGIPMELRWRGRPLQADREALRQAYSAATGRVAVFVHGLMANDEVWRFFARPEDGPERADYGGRLQQDLGFAPVYVRFNSGRHISQNGRDLAELLERLVDAWPVPIEQIALIGHSMGGLVARSACHYAGVGSCRWPALTRRVVCLGSPHRGSPLEKLANVASGVLAAFAETQALAGIANARSAGIKDLRFGYLIDEDWDGHDPDSVLRDEGQDVVLLETAAHAFAAATLTGDIDHPVGRAIGDSLVRIASATGGATRNRPSALAVTDTAFFGGISHLALVNHPEVYEALRNWLADHEATPSEQSAAPI